MTAKPVGPKVLITGAAGYIGRFCVRHLLAAGYGVVALDRRAVALDSRAQSIVGDITDGPLVARLLDEHAIDVVLHLAADKSVAESMSAPGPHLRNNVCGSLALLEAMLEGGVNKIVFSSSAAVYGTPERLPVDEQARLAPENPYGAGKVMVEQALHWYHVSHGFDSVSLRYFNAAGAAHDGSDGEDGAEASNLVPLVMQALAGSSKPLSVYGTDFPTPDGTAVRDYVHVEDLAAAHLRALELVGRDRGEWVFNLGTGRGHSVREVLLAAERASGRPVPHRDTARRAGDPAQVWADASAAERVLGWRAERGLDDIVHSAPGYGSSGVAEQSALGVTQTVDFNLHGYVGIRLLDAQQKDAAKVSRQLGPLQSTLTSEPDITIRFVDRLAHGPLTYVGWQESGFDERAFYLLTGKDRVQAKALIPFHNIGARCDIICERGLPAVPLLLAVVNMTALAKGLLPLHASAFLYEGQGVLATGWAKGGKTEALLAFMSRGARYVGDEWVYLTPNRRMLGIPEPIRLWRWQLQQLPVMAARLRRREQFGLAALDALSSGAERLAPRAGRGGLAGSLLRRSAPVLRRQVNVQVPPARLFGAEAIALEGPLDHVIFISSHEESQLRLESTDARELTSRMAASLAHERHELLNSYGEFRFAFPQLSSSLLERAADMEAELLGKAFAGLPISWLRHPYPCDIGSLFAPIAEVIST